MCVPGCPVGCRAGRTTVIAFTSPPGMRLGPVGLAVRDLDAELDFYCHVLGLRILSRRGDQRVLGLDGAPDPLLVLTWKPTAQRPPRYSTGLYHVALLVPSRRGLADVIRHIRQRRYPLQGRAHHIVSEAIYLADPEGNGIEVYADTPRDAWHDAEGEWRMDTLPLDVAGILAELPEAGATGTEMPAGTRIGHVHLKVSAVDEAERFYTQVLGLTPTMRLGSHAVFLAAGGYHHHVAANSWESAGAPPPPPDSLGLRYVTFVLPGAEWLPRLEAHLQTLGVPYDQQRETLRLHDPAGNRIHVAWATAAGAHSREAAA